MSLAENFAATTIDIPVKDGAFKDPLPFKLFVGYMFYPTERNYVAMSNFLNNISVLSVSRFANMWAKEIYEYSFN